MADPDQSGDDRQGGFFSRLLPWGDREEPDKPDITVRVNGSIYDTIRTAGLGADNIIIGDGRHTDSGMRQFLTGPALVQSLAEAGALHICLEVPKELDPLRAQYVNGEISRENFVATLNIVLSQPVESELSDIDYINGFVDIIDSAKRLGMESHFVDPHAEQRNYRLSQETRETLERILPAYEEATGQSLGRRPALDEIARVFVFAKGRGEVSDAEAGRFMDDVYTSRTNDRALARSIEEATGGEKAGIIYGAGHDNLAARLGGSLLVVDVYPDAAAYQAVHNATQVGYDYKGQPDIVHLVDSNETFLTEKADPHLTAGLSSEAATAPVPEPPAVARDAPTSEPAPRGRAPG